jgi:hypothetical protein
LLKSRKRDWAVKYVPRELAADVEVTGVDVIARAATLHALLKDKTSPGETAMIEIKIS